MSDGGHQNRAPAMLPPVLRKHSGKITAFFCLQASLIMGMETSYVSVFANTPEFDSTYFKSQFILQGLLQSSYMLFACCK